MQIDAASVEEYLARVPEGHRAALTRVRDVMRRHLPSGFEEGVLYGMIAWFVPPERHGTSYNGQPLMIASLASQKHYMALYLTGVYGDPAVHRWFTSSFAAAGKKLDMGKSCVRFRRLDDLPLDVIGQVAARVSVDDTLAAYEQAQAGRKQKPIVLPGRGAGKTSGALNKKAAAAKPKSTPKNRKTPAETSKKEPSASKAKPSPSKTKPSVGKMKPSPSKANTPAKASKKPSASKARASVRKTKPSAAKAKPSPQRSR
jgi:Domain of unknown function (DU1801)